MIGLKWIVAPGIQRNPHRITAFTTGPSIGAPLWGPQWEQRYGKEVTLVEITGVIWAFMRGNVQVNVTLKKTATLQ